MHKSSSWVDNSANKPHISNVNDRGKFSLNNFFAAIVTTQIASLLNVSFASFQNVNGGMLWESRWLIRSHKNWMLKGQHSREASFCRKIASKACVSTFWKFKICVQWHQAEPKVERLPKVESAAEKVGRISAFFVPAILSLVSILMFFRVGFTFGQSECLSMMSMSNDFCTKLMSHECRRLDVE